MSKRGNGEGSIYFDERSGLYRASLSLTNGKRKYLSGKTRSVVATRLTDALKAKAEGLPATDDRLTLERHLSQWLDTVVKPGVRPATFDSYESVVRVHLVPTLGKRRLTRIQPEDVQRLLSNKVAEGKLSARSVNYVRRILSMALGQAVAWGRVSRNVAGLGDGQAGQVASSPDTTPRP
jgi:hypothetical protein